MNETDEASIPDLEAYVEAYESAQEAGRCARLEDFVPDVDHPQYAEIVVELIRADLEFSWEQGDAHELRLYQTRFPHVFSSSSALEQVAFEEYRLRYKAGQQVTPAEYAARYGIGTDSWPVWPDKSPSREASLTAAEEPFELCSSWLAQLSQTAPAVAERVRDAAGRFPHLGSRFRGFELVGELGRGAFGRVYLARQGELANRFVALKITVETSSEPQRLAQLQHTNIVPIYSAHREGQLQAVCMPFLGATTLADILNVFQRQQSMPKSGQALLSTMEARQTATLGNGHSPSHRDVRAAAEETDHCRPSASLNLLASMNYQDAVVWIAAKIANGLAHAHDHGIVHRDLKPANILISDDGQPLILDFNLSSQATAHGSDVALVGGTLPYMAPEHIEAIRTNGKVDHRSDIYSLGVILFEMLAGRTPYPPRSGTFEQMTSQMLADRRSAPPSVRRFNASVTPGVESILARCLAPDPADRYATARELEIDLQRHLDHLPLRYAPNRSLHERGKKWARRHPRLASATTVTVVSATLLLILLALWLIRGNQIARLTAQESLRSLQSRLASLRTPLTVLDADAGTLNEAASEAKDVLSRHAALDSNQWQNQAPFALLNDSQQEQLRQAIGELRYLLAASLARQARRSGDADARRQLLAEALRVNQLAQSSFFKHAAPRAFLAQEANLLEQSGRSERAGQIREKMADTPIDGPLDRQLLAVEHVMNGRYRPALALLEAAARESPQHFSIWYLLGNCHVGLRQFTDALGCYNTCIALNPDSRWAYYQRGNLRLDLKNYEAARADFDRALAISIFPAALVNRALACKALGDYQQALADLTQALDRGATQTRIFFIRSRVRRHLGDVQGAEHDLREGLRRQPTDDLSWISRGVAQLSDAPRAALADFRQALKLNPHSPVALQNIASVLSERLGETDQALRAMHKLIALEPAEPKPLATRGILLARLGRRDAALADAQVALRLRRDADTLYRVAGIYALTSRQQQTDATRSLQLLAEAAWHSPELVKTLTPLDPDLAPLHNQQKFQALLDGLDDLKRYAHLPH